MFRVAEQFRGLSIIFVFIIFMCMERVRHMNADNAACVKLIMKRSRLICKTHMRNWWGGWMSSTVPRPRDRRRTQLRPALNGMTGVVEFTICNDDLYEQHVSTDKYYTLPAVVHLSAEVETNFEFWMDWTIVIVVCITLADIGKSNIRIFFCNT